MEIDWAKWVCPILLPISFIWDQIQYWSIIIGYYARYKLNYDFYHITSSQLPLSFNPIPICPQLLLLSPFCHFSIPNFSYTPTPTPTTISTPSPTPTPTPTPTYTPTPTPTPTPTMHISRFWGKSHEERVKSVQDQVIRWKTEGNGRKMCTARPSWMSVSQQVLGYKDKMYK